MRDTTEEFNREQLITQTTVKTLCIAILPRTAWLDVQGLNAKLLQPPANRLGNELRTIVAAYVLGHPVHHEQLRESIDDVLCLEAPRDIQRDTSACVLVDDCEDLQRLTALCSIEDKVPAPYMAGVCSTQAVTSVGACSKRALLPAFSWHFEPFLSPYPIDTLVVYSKAFRPKQTSYLTVSKTWTLTHKRQDPSSQLSFIKSNSFAVAKTATLKAYPPTCPTF